MSTRNIKDAKDLNTGELIYFKGHAQATFMSDGRTVEEAVSGMSGGSGGGRKVTFVNSTNVDITLHPNEIVICDKVQSLIINSIERTPADGEDTSTLYDEYMVIFGSPGMYNPTLPGTEPTPPLTLPADVIWANGVIPEIETNTWYELSITRNTYLNTSIFRAVLTPFKPVE